MKQFFALLSLTSLLFVSAAAQSQPSTITLDQALSIALERNVTIAQAANGIDNAKASVVSAYGSYIPRLSANAGFNRLGYSSPPTVRIGFGGIPTPYPRTDSWNNTYSGSVGLWSLLFDGFNREATFNTASTNQLSAEQTYGRTRQSIAYAVISSYLTVLRNEQQDSVFQQTLNNEKNRLDRVMEQNRLGAVAIGDVYRQQSTVAQAEYNLISGQNTYDKSVADLVNLLALDVSQNYRIADPSIAGQIKQVETAPGVQSLGSYGELLKRALDSRPDYAIAQEGVSMADNGITQAWSSYYPSLNVNAGYATNAQTWDVASRWDNHSTSVGLSLSWQLPEIFGAIQRIQTANISKRNAVLQVQQMERDISVQLKKALLDLDASQKQYAASVKSQVAAEQDRKTAEAKYNLGSGTLLDLQVANTTYLNAQLTTLFNAYNYYTVKKNLDLVIGEKKY